MKFWWFSLDLYIFIFWVDSLTMFRMQDELYFFFPLTYIDTHFFQRIKEVRRRRRRRKIKDCSCTLFGCLYLLSIMACIGFPCYSRRAVCTPQKRGNKITDFSAKALQYTADSIETLLQVLLLRYVRDWLLGRWACICRNICICSFAWFQATFFFEN